MCIYMARQPAGRPGHGAAGEHRPPARLLLHGQNTPSPPMKSFPIESP